MIKIDGNKEEFYMAGTLENLCIEAMLLLYHVHDGIASEDKEEAAIFQSFVTGCVTNVIFKNKEEMGRYVAQQRKDTNFERFKSLLDNMNIQRGEEGGPEEMDS